MIALSLPPLPLLHTGPRALDLAFLADVVALRTAGDIWALVAMQVEHRFSKEWKRIAVSRAIAAVQLKGVE